MRVASKKTPQAETMMRLGAARRTESPGTSVVAPVMSMSSCWRSTSVTAEAWMPSCAKLAALLPLPFSLLNCVAVTVRVVMSSSGTLPSFQWRESER